MNVKGGLTAFLDLVATKTVKTAPGTFQTPISASQKFASGTSAGQIDQVSYLLDETIGPSVTQSHDIKNGTVTALYGGPLIMKRVKGLCIINKSGNGQLLKLLTFNVDIFNDGSDEIRVPDGGAVIWTNPANSGAGVVTTNGAIKIDNPGGALTGTFDLVILGLKV